MKNILFPTIRIEKPSRELAQVYARMMKPPEIKKGLPFMLGLCAVTIAVPFWAAGATPLVMLYVCPTLFLTVAFVCAAFIPNFSRFGGVLSFIALENFIFVIFPAVLVQLLKAEYRMLVLYYLFLMFSFVWVVVQYRLCYKKFDDIMQARIHNMRYPQKSPWAGFLGAVSLAVIIRFIINTFALWSIGAACVFLIAYYLNPLIAEQIVIMRQRNQMEPYLQEYAEEENEPEV